MLNGPSLPLLDYGVEVALLVRGASGERAILVKVPSDLITPGWMCRKKLKFMA
jgi:hypothetical protein